MHGFLADTFSLEQADCSPASSGLAKIYAAWEAATWEDLFAFEAYADKVPGTPGYANASARSARAIRAQTDLEEQILAAPVNSLRDAMLKLSVVREGLERDLEIEKGISEQLTAIGDVIALLARIGGEA